MSFNELQSSVNSFPGWKAILWCFYPMTSLVLIELLARLIDSDDDQDGGKLIPVIQRAQ